MATDYSPILDVVDFASLAQTVLAIIGLTAVVWVAYDGAMWLLDAITGVYYRAKYGHLLDDE